MDTFLRFANENTELVLIFEVPDLNCQSLKKQIKMMIPSAHFNISDLDENEILERVINESKEKNKNKCLKGFVFTKEKESVRVLYEIDLNAKTISKADYIV